MSQKACIFWTLQEIWRKPGIVLIMKHIIKQEKWASIKSKLLKTTFEFLVTVYSNRQKECYTTTNRTTLLNDVWKWLLTSYSFRQYSDQSSTNHYRLYLSSPLTQTHSFFPISFKCTISEVHHRSSLSQFSLKRIITSRLLNSWNVF